MFEIEQTHDRRLDLALKHYLRTIGRYELLQRHEEAELAALIRGGDQEALDHLVNANLRFVVSVAKRFLGRGLSLMDLLAEGNVGLITAARRFDERREFRFVTYAVWWIRQSIQAALQDQVRTVRLPANRAREARKITTHERLLEQERMGPVTDEELADAVEVDARNVARIRAASRPNVPLDTPAHPSGSTLAEVLPDPTGSHVAEDVEADCMRLDLTTALERLDERERQIINDYYGLGDAQAKSLEAIGTALELSRERVRQIRNRAFAKLRDCAQGPVLAEYLG